MITPNDIQKKEFSKGRGFREEEVDAFLDEITESMSALIAENDDLKKQVEQYKQKCKEQEESVYVTLKSAKELMAQISESAEKRADILLKNAQLDADNLIRQTKDSVAILKEEEKVLKNRVYTIKLRLKNILETELSHVESLDQDLVINLDDNTEKEEALSASDASQAVSQSVFADQIENGIGAKED